MGISHFTYFFTNNLLLSVYFMFILDSGNEGRQEANLCNFLEFKMGHKVAETTCNINNTFGLGTANEHTMQWWFKKFCKGPLKMRNTGWPSEVDNDQLRGPSKLLLLQLHEKLLKNSTSTILWSFSIGSKLER